MCTTLSFEYRVFVLMMMMMMNVFTTVTEQLKLHKT